MKTKYLHPRSALTADDVVSIRIAVALCVFDELSDPVDFASSVFCFALQPVSSLSFGGQNGELDFFIAVVIPVTIPSVWVALDNVETIHLHLAGYTAHSGF